jgi:hypothetical protein
VEGKIDKGQRLAWAYAVLKDAVDGSIHGNVMFNFQDGSILSSKTEKTERPIS